MIKMRFKRTHIWRRWGINIGHFTKVNADFETHVIEGLERLVGAQYIVIKSLTNLWLEIWMKDKQSNKICKRSRLFIPNRKQHHRPTRTTLKPKCMIWTHTPARIHRERAYSEPCGWLEVCLFLLDAYFSLDRYHRWLWFDQWLSGLMGISLFK